MRPSPPIPQFLRPQCILSKFPPRFLHIQKIYRARLLDQIDVVSICLSQRQGDIHCSKRYYWSVKWYSEPPFIGCLPIRQEILTVSQIAVTLHGNPPTIHCPDLTATAPQRCLPLLCALLSQQSHLFLICVALTHNDFRIIPHKTFQIPRSCQCEWL